MDVGGVGAQGRVLKWLIGRNRFVRMEGLE